MRIVKNLWRKGDQVQFNDKFGTTGTLTGRYNDIPNHGRFYDVLINNNYDYIHSIHKDRLQIIKDKEDVKKDLLQMGRV